VSDLRAPRQLKAIACSGMKLRTFTGVLWSLAILRWLVKFGRWAFALFVVVRAVMDHDGFVDLALTALLLVLSWWGLGRMLLVIDDAGGRLWVAILKIREPEACASIAALSDAERRQLEQEMLHHRQGGAIGAKIRAFNRGELPKTEMDAMRERFRKAGF
jgi:hypothetical protein